MRSSLARRKERRNARRVSLSEHTIIVLAVLDECPYYTSLPSRHLRSRILPWTFSPAVPTVLRDPSSSLAVSWNRASSSSSSSLSASLSLSSFSCPALVRFSRRKSLSFHYYCPILPLTSFFMPLRRSLCDATRICGGLRWPG